MDELPYDPPPRARRSVYLYLAPAALQTEDYDKVRYYIDQVKTLVSRSGHNWIGIHIYQVVLGFRLNDLDLVRAATEAIRATKHYRLMAEELRIFETYLAILSGEQPKLGKFPNETIQFSADKKGMNVNILILQCLIFISRGDRPAIVQRQEALQQYAYRYLYGDPAMRRSELFFRLLLVLAKSGFDRDIVNQRSPQLLEELQRTPRHIGAIDVEVVAYEWLWEKILAWI